MAFVLAGVDELFVHDVMAEKALHLSLMCLMIIHGVQVMAIANGGQPVQPFGGGKKCML
jgi:hypothetical protein